MERQRMCCQEQKQWHHSAHLTFLFQIPGFKRRKTFRNKHTIWNKNIFALIYVYTFISSTKEGNPPIVMNVKKEAMNISREPLS
jgi:hypothetical protein